MCTGERERERRERREREKRERCIKVICDWLELPVCSSVFYGVSNPTLCFITMLSRPKPPSWITECRAVFGKQFSDGKTWTRRLRMASECTGMVSSRTYPSEMIYYYLGRL
jgi:hypothetical protein